MNTAKVVISPKSVVIFIAFILLVWLVYKIQDVLLLLFASFIIASALYPFVDGLSQKMPRGIAVLLVYLIGFIILGTILVPLSIVLTQQIREFFTNLPEYLMSVDRYMDNWRIGYGYLNILPDFSQIMSSIVDIGPDILSQTINITMIFITGIVAIFTLAVILSFLLMDKNELKNGFLSFFPESIRPKAASILVAISHRVGEYVRGQLMLMLAVGLLTTSGLFIIGVNYALLLGLVAGVLEIVPIIGPILAAIPAVFVALAQDPVLALWTILVYLIVQRIENSFLAPIIMSKFLDMHPLIILIALLIAASTLGVIGVILSPAIAAVIYILVQELYLKKINQEQ